MATGGVRTAHGSPCAGSTPRPSPSGTSPIRPSRTRLLATIRYPAAGTANANVTLHLLGLDGSAPAAVDWDRDFFPYLAAVHWGDGGLLVLVQSREPAGLYGAARAIDTEDGTTLGETTVLSHDYDDAWVELVPGTPRLLDDGRLVHAARS